MDSSPGHARIPMLVVFSRYLAADYGSMAEEFEGIPDCQVVLDRRVAELLQYGARAAGLSLSGGAARGAQDGSRIQPDSPSSSSASQRRLLMHPFGVANFAGPERKATYM